VPIEQRASRDFWKLLDRLPSDQQALARKRFKNFCLEDPRHPAPRGKFVPDKTLAGTLVCRVDAGANNSALAIYSKAGALEIFSWYWIGSHEAYNERLS
jgi:hypothetical protein